MNVIMCNNTYYKEILSKMDKYRAELERLTREKNQNNTEKDYSSNKIKVLDNKITDGNKQIGKNNEWIRTAIVLIVSFLIILSALSAAVKQIFLLPIVGVVVLGMLWLLLLNNRKTRLNNDHSSLMAEKDQEAQRLIALKNRDVELEQTIKSYTEYEAKLSTSLDNINMISNHANIFANKYRYRLCDEALIVLSESFNTLELLKHLAKYSNSYKKVTLMTRKEFDFYKKLQKISEKHDYIVFTHVRLWDIINVGDFRLKSNYDEGWLKKKVRFYEDFISNKHIDFLLMDFKKNKQLCIELDDPSHYDSNLPFYKKSQAVNHLVKDILLSYCGISLLRLDDTVHSDLEELILSAFSEGTIKYGYTQQNMELFKKSLMTNSVMFS